jgi:hypothetical protein
MASQTPAATANAKPSANTKGKATAAATTAPNRQPPDEQFWVRYSPHHEFPLSSVTSLALHILAMVFLALAGWLAFKLGFGENKPPSISAVSIDAGGGGNKRGREGGVFGGGAAQEDVQQQEKQPEIDTKDLDKNLKENVGEAPPVEFKIDKSTREVPAFAKDALKQLGGLAGDLGRGGPGTGGGKGAGSGTGTGFGSGAGRAPTEREKRVLRWSMKFSTQNGNDYLQQLRDIKPGGGAILAVSAGGNRYEVFRDLAKNPVTGKVEDLSSLNRIFWVDDQPDSVRNLARAMGIKAPPFIVAFFPVELENELVRLEREKSGGAKEDDIDDTRFEVVRDSNGYRAKCISVHIKGRR